MKIAVRAGSLLVGVTAALLVPAAAIGQIDAGQTVGQAVGEVGNALSPAQPQVPVQVPAPPVQVPSAPAQPAPQPAPSAPAAPAPAPSGAGSAAAASGGGAKSGGASGSLSTDAGKAAARGNANAKAGAAAKKKAGGPGVVLAQKDTGELSAPEGESFSGAVTPSPSTGVQGDPDLPFTGGHVLLLLAMGGVAFAAGLALRTAARRRHAG